MIDEVRDLAEQPPEAIRQQIDLTRSSITSKLEAIEDQVVGTVQSAKETMQETIDNVKETVEETVSTVKETVQDTVSSVKETFDLRLQVERHPWPMLGGSFAAGLVAGALLGKGQQQRPAPVPEPWREPPPPTRNSLESLRPGFFDRYQEEIDQVKGLAIGFVLGLVRDAIKENVPQYSEQIGDLVDQVTAKLGGSVVK
jgi:ElaB/YqjD/DUF883 family membrane-anchored ribosome-binding protein